EEESIQEHVMKLPIDLEQYPIPKGNALREDQVVLEKFPDAGAIRELYRRRKMTTKENMVDFLLFPGIQEVQDHWRDASKYYLIERNSCHFLVNVTENAVLTRRLAIDVSGKSFELAGDKFIKTRRKLK
ncbi:transcriptional regulator, partial [Enterococcus sp. 3H8_DIV0648]|uniref:transcriptional regulator n=2 Tax=Enterococcus TaxID=1350 RepID=UPI000B5AAEA8